MALQEAVGPPFAEVHVADAIAKTDEGRAAVISQTEPAVEIGLPQGPQDLLLTLAAQVEGEKDAVNFGRRVRIWRVTFQLGTEEVGPRVVASVLEELLAEKPTQPSDENALRNDLGGRAWPDQVANNNIDQDPDSLGAEDDLVLRDRC